MFITSLIIIFLISFLLAIKASQKELSVPQEVKKLKISPKNRLFGVILFLKKKIIHYSSSLS